MASIRRVQSSILVALAALFCACASPQAAPPELASQPYRIGPPDVLVITILPDPVIEREVTVRPDGMVSVDLVGDIPAAGRTAEEIGTDIEQRISRFKRDANVTVSLSSARSSEVTILGEVSRPGTFPLARETRLVEGLGQVGGTRLFASKDSIRIIRLEDGQSKVYYADLEAIEQGDLSTNYLLRGGDVVIVPPTGIARVGYAMQSFLFPLQQLIGFGSQVTTTVFTGAP